MKKMLLVLAVTFVVLFGATGVFAAADTTITNYFSGYLLVTNTCADAGTTGLTTGETYACFLVSDIDFLTDAQAHHTNSTSSINDLIRGITEEAYTTIAATTSTNRPTKMQINKSVKTSSGTADFTETLRIDTEVTITSGSAQSE